VADFKEMENWCESCKKQYLRKQYLKRQYLKKQYLKKRYSKIAGRR